MYLTGLFAMVLALAQFSAVLAAPGGCFLAVELMTLRLIVSSGQI